MTEGCQVCAEWARQRQLLKEKRRRYYLKHRDRIKLRVIQRYNERKAGA